MSGVVSGGAALLGSLYTVDAQKSAARKQMRAMEEQAKIEEEALAEQLRIQEEQGRLAVEAQNRATAQAAAAAADAKKQEAARVAAEQAMKESERQSQASEANVDVAGTSERRGQRRGKFFDRVSNLADLASGGGFRV
jgi:membrane protein involved in colicin uptake